MLADPKLKKIHPLGKAPVVEIESPATSQPLVLAESGAIVEYLLDHCGKWLIPDRYQEGKQDQIAVRPRAACGIGFICIMPRAASCR